MSSFPPLERLVSLCKVIRQTCVSVQELEAGEARALVLGGDTAALAAHTERLKGVLQTFDGLQLLHMADRAAECIILNCQ